MLQDAEARNELYICNYQEIGRKDLYALSGVTVQMGYSYKLSLSV
jgi:hypothetical protein